MVFKCSIVNCDGNYNKTQSCRVYRLPQDKIEKQIWINAIPSFQEGKVKVENFRVCERHWPENTPMIKVRSGMTRPSTLPNILNVPRSCLPTPKPQPRKPKKEFALQSALDQKDKIKSFELVIIVFIIFIFLLMISYLIELFY